MRLIDFYHSYTERKDQQFKLLSEANKEVRFSKHDGDVMIFDDAFDPRDKGYGRWLSEVKNPVQWLKSLRVVQIITVVANGKACSREPHR
jgi:hypothetical protein